MPRSARIFPHRMGTFGGLFLKLSSCIDRANITRAVLAATFGAALLSAVGRADAGIVFQQNFNNGGAVSDYVGTGANLFHEIAPSGSGVSFTIANNTLEAIR